MGKHLSKYSSEADYNNNKDTHLKPHVSLITTSPKKIKFEKKILVNLIAFHINGAEYQAEEGMTWEEWVESEYNTDKLTTIEGDLKLVHYNNEPSSPLSPFVMYGDDIILNNTHYVFGMSGGI